MNIIILKNNKVECINDRTQVLTSTDIKILEECNDDQLKDKIAYWQNIINPQPEPKVKLRYQKNNVTVYDYDYGR